MLILAGSACAARVGVVADNGEGRITEACYEVGEGEPLDFLCDKPNYRCDDYGWGKMVTHIDGDDCPWVPDSKWWALFKDGKSSMVGISDITAEDGTLIGWRCGQGEEPESTATFCDICGCGGGLAKVILPVMGMAVAPEAPTVDERITIKLTDEKSDKPVRNAVVEVFDGVAGVTAPLFEGDTGNTGEVEFSIDEPGEYTIRVTGTKYEHEYQTLKVDDTTTTTTTSSTTTTSTTATTTTSTTTTYNPPRHFLLKETTTTLKPTTTTSEEEPKIIGNAIEPQPKKNGGLIAWILSFFG
ncbi:MAG: hypothetical protein GF416_08605 [Candidatus Altiarchaeales archaeon]|nr:hypothetical protein [Candidatus Altiarchaeales archaeon]